MKEDREPSRQVLAFSLRTARLFGLTVGLCCLIGALLTATAPIQAQGTADGAYVTKDDRVIDLRSGVEWLRCSLGQQFEEGACTGDVLRLSQDEVKEAIQIANRDLGGNWYDPWCDDLRWRHCPFC